MVNEREGIRGFSEEGDRCSFLLIATDNLDGEVLIIWKINIMMILIVWLVI